MCCRTRMVDAGDMQKRLYLPHTAHSKCVVRGRADNGLAATHPAHLTRLHLASPRMLTKDEHTLPPRAPAKDGQMPSALSFPPIRPLKEAFVQGAEAGNPECKREPAQGSLEWQAASTLPQVQKNHRRGPQTDFPGDFCCLLFAPAAPCCLFRRTRALPAGVVKLSFFAVS